MRSERSDRELARNRDYMREYAQRPEVKERRRAYMRDWMRERRARQRLADRLWAKVVKGEDCWVFQTGGEYGLMWNGQYRPNGAKKQESAHRISWRLANGPIPDGMLVLHHCDNPPCVRPDHLFLGTSADNIHDAMAKGRIGKGLSSDRFPLDRPNRAWLATKRREASE